jgi:hypothetical protein
MPFLNQAIEAVRARESSSPRTILGVLLAIYGVLISGSVVVVIAMVGSDSDGPIPWILLFDALITMALGAAILVITWKDPSRLMLGQLTGREYESIRRLHVGDDKAGEHQKPVVPPSQVLELEENSESAQRVNEQIQEEPEP